MHAIPHPALLCVWKHRLWGNKERFNSTPTFMCLSIHPSPLRSKQPQKISWLQQQYVRRPELPLLVRCFGNTTREADASHSSSLFFLSRFLPLLSSPLLTLSARLCSRCSLTLAASLNHLWLSVISQHAPSPSSLYSLSLPESYCTLQSIATSSYREKEAWVCRKRNADEWEIWCLTAPVLHTLEQQRQEAAEAAWGRWLLVWWQSAAGCNGLLEATSTPLSMWLLWWTQT